MRERGKSKFYLLKVVIASLALALLVVGCAAPSTGGETAAEEPQAEAQEAEAMEQEPMVILTTGELVSMDPMYTLSDAVLNQNHYAPKKKT